ncbi:MAG: hypothetical protein AAF627_22170, partial [Myxococcota bacterium]
GNFEIEIVAVDIQEDLRPLAETIIGERIQMAFVRAPPDGTRAVLFGATQSSLPQTASTRGTQGRWNAYAFEGGLWTDYPCETFSGDLVSLASEDPRFGAVIQSLRLADDEPADGLDLRTPEVEMAGEWWLAYDDANASGGTALAPLNLQGTIVLDEDPPSVALRRRMPRGPVGTGPFVLPFDTFLIDADEFVLFERKPSFGLVFRDERSTIEPVPIHERGGLFGCVRLNEGGREYDGAGSVVLTEFSVAPQRWFEGPRVTLETTEPARDLFGQPSELIRAEYAVLSAPEPVSEVNFREGSGVTYFADRVAPVAPCEGRPCVGLEVLEGRRIGFMAAVRPQPPRAFRSVSILARIDAEDCRDDTRVDVGVTGSSGPDASLELFGGLASGVRLRRSGDGCISGFLNLGPSELGDGRSTRQSVTVAYQFAGRNLTGPTTVTVLQLVPTE